MHDKAFAKKNLQASRIDLSKKKPTLHPFFCLWSKISPYLTVKPSSRKHFLCASIRSAQCSSPFETIHRSLAFFVSGQLQHIFFPLFPSFGGGLDAAVVCGLACSLPMIASWRSFCVHVVSMRPRPGWACWDVSTNIGRTMYWPDNKNNNKRTSIVWNSSSTTTPL